MKQLSLHCTWFWSLQVCVFRNFAVNLGAISGFHYSLFSAPRGAAQKKSSDRPFNPGREDGFIKENQFINTIGRHLCKPPYILPESWSGNPARNTRLCAECKCCSVSQAE